MRMQQKVKSLLSPLLICFCILFLTGTPSPAQNKFATPADSLRHTFEHGKMHDSLRYWALSDLAWEYCYINPDSARIFARMQLRYYEKYKPWIRFKTDAYNTIGNSFLIEGKYDSALVYFLMNEVIQKKRKDKNALIATYTNIAEVYRNLGNFPMALRFSNKALKSVDQASKYEIDKGILYNNIGAIYAEQHDHKSSLKEYHKAADIFKKLKEYRELANAYTNISLSHELLKDFQQAKKYSYLALSLRTKQGDSIQISNSYQHISNLYYEFGQFDSALHYAEAAVRISDRINNSDGLSGALPRAGMASLELGKTDDAIRYCLRGYKIAKENDIIHYLQNNCTCLFEAYKTAGNSREALRYYEEAEQIEDTLINDERTQQIARLSVQYEFDKKTAQDSVANAQVKKVKDAEILAQKSQLKQEETLRYALYGGLFLLVVFGLFMYNRFQVTNRQKKIIQEQKNEVEHQKEIVEEKNKEILDSINYAKRLQEAILPPMKLVKEYLNDSFILYKPKDIVAGDFYFMEPVEDKIVFAAADCTGHGVPGAMVSVVCANAMNRAVKEFSLVDPGKILDKVRELILATFEKSESEVKDGMDISLCVLDLKAKELFWSGANNPIWIIRKSNGALEEIKPDKQPVGMSPEPKPFRTHKINLEKEDSVYLFTDGFEDQFGGEKGKKFKSSKMKELFLSIQNETMDKQRSLVFDTFEKWKGDLEQVDDVCIIGIKIGE